MLKSLLVSFILSVISMQAFAIQKMLIKNMGAVDLFDSLNLNVSSTYTETLAVRKLFQTSSQDFSIECFKGSSVNSCTLLRKDEETDQNFVETMRIEGKSAEELYNILRVVPFIPQEASPGINPLVSRRTLLSEDQQIRITCEMRLYTKKCEIKYSAFSMNCGH